MFSKIIAAIFTSFLMLSLVACSDGETSASSDTSTSETVRTDTSEGVWTYEKDDSKFVATITENAIEIQWHPDTDTSGLYWKGDFEVSELEDGMVVTSNADTEALEASIYGAQADTKNFVYEDGELSFDFIIMGTTTNIAMTK